MQNRSATKSQCYLTGVVQDSSQYKQLQNEFFYIYILTLPSNRNDILWPKSLAATLLVLNFVGL